MHRLYTALFWVFCATCHTATTMADTPVGPMNYQGRLLNDAGIPVTGSYNFVVKIYDDPASGTLEYQESHNAVSVDDGVYSFKVGTGTSVTGNWDIDLWQGNLNDLFLELVVNGETLTPRHELTSAPHAFTSTFALSANALGNKTAAEYDNILEGVCVASKGIWLETAEKCLGAGASFPGPTQVALNTLTNKTNLSNLDLTEADISGINFGASANLSGTLFKGTTYSVQGVSNTDLTDTVWDGAIASDAAAYSVGSNTNLTRATFKNMAMNKWDISQVQEWYYYRLSAAYLSSCPAGLPNVWKPWICKLMRTGGSNYFLFGPKANFSANSAAAIKGIGGTYLDLDADVFDGHQWGYASFEGVTITQNFTNSWLYFSTLDNATIRNASFYGTNFNGATLKGAVLENITFAEEMWGGLSADFTNATLNNVVFNCGTEGNFTGAVLRQVDFTSSIGQTVFTNASLENVRINYLFSNWPTNTFDNTRIYGQFHITNLQDNTVENLLFKDMKFYGATVSGDLTGATFTGTPVFSNTIFENLDLCAATIPLAGAAPHTELASVLWRRNNECPDGTDIGGSGTCDTGARMTPTAVVNCTSGTPIPQ